MFLTLSILSNKQAANHDLSSNEVQSLLGNASKLQDAHRRITFWYVVDKSTMVPVKEILQYLKDCATRKSNADNTIKAKAEALREFFLYLHASGTFFEESCLDTLIEYKERMTGFISEKTGRPLAQATISLRVKFAREFLIFHNIICKSDEVVVRVRRPLVAYLGDTDLLKLLSALGGPPGTKDGYRRCRDWLIAVFCVTTGARVSEALSLTVSQITAAACEEGSTVLLHLEGTKGGKSRTIKVDRDVITHMVAYIDGERQDSIDIGRKSRHGQRDSLKLFVNGPDCAAAYSGRPYQQKRCEEYFAAKQIEIGMTKEIAVYDPVSEEEQPPRLISKYLIHHLRHSYAIRAWQNYRDLPETDRWIKIQLQLGHASFETTRDVYLRAVTQAEGEARDAYGDILQRMRRG